MEKRKARLQERAGARVEALLHRLCWALGARSKRSGDALAALAGRLAAVHPRHRLRLARQQVSAAARQLEAMSHRGVLRRGFSVTRGARGTILRSVAEVARGDAVETELADGRFTGVVESVPAGGRGAKPDAPPPARAAPKRAPQQPGLFDT